MKIGEYKQMNAYLTRPGTPEQKKKAEENKKKREEMIAMIAGIGISIVVIVLGGRWAIRKIKHRMKNENE